MDALSGSLDTFPLEAVLRLIGGAGRPGVLKIENTGLAGRIFVADHGVVHATTREVTGPRRGAGPDRRTGTFGDDPTLDGGDARLAQIVEVVVRLMRDAHGDFSFLPGVGPPADDLAGGRGYDVVDVLAAARSHVADWDRIEPLVPDAETRFTVARELPAEIFEVTLDARKWIFLAAVGEGASVRELAEILGIFEYPAAMHVAEMAQQGLLVADSDTSSRAVTGPDMTVTTSFTPAGVAAPPVQVAVEGAEG